MSENSPRWPGTDGAPGLDFSPRRRPETESGAAGPQPMEQSAGGAEGQAPAGRRSATSVQTPSRPAEEPAEPQAVADATEVRNGAEAPRPQESAAAWAWQPMSAESAGGRRSVTSSQSADDVSAIAGGAARAAETSRRSSAVGAAAAATTAAGAGASAARTSSTRRLGTRRTRKARLRLARLDPWSVMKTTFLFSIAFGIMMMVIAWVLWTVLSGSGALDSVNQFMTTLIGDQDGGRFQVEDWINGPRVLGFAALIAAIDVVILTAVATLFAFLYNLAATVIGGLEVTLAED